MTKTRRSCQGQVVPREIAVDRPWAGAGSCPSRESAGSLLDTAAPGRVFATRRISANPDPGPATSSQFLELRRR